MANDVVLSAASRSNLLSLQSTQKMIDSTQLRLATGKKVNSALDNPQSFFQSQSLSNRASDLTRLLDGIGQSIRTIEGADKGITALTKLVEQAGSIADEAQSTMLASQGYARVAGSKDLSSVGNLFTAGGGGVISATANTFNVVFTNYDAETDLVTQKTIAVTIASGNTVDNIVASINSSASNNKEILASVGSGGQLVIQSLKEGANIRIEQGAANGLTSAGFTALGFGDFVASENAAHATNVQTGATAIAGNKLKSVISNAAKVDGQYQASATLAAAGFLGAAGHSFNMAITIDGQQTTVTTAGGALTGASTVQGMIDAINTSGIGDKVTASFNTTTGQIELEFANSVGKAELEFTSTTAGTAVGFGFGSGEAGISAQTMVAANGGAAAAGTPDVIAANAITSEQFVFSGSTADLDRFQKDYNKVRSQIDSIVKDANYRGVNLLEGDKLTTYFNEDRSSTLTTEGVDFTALGLGISEANFGDNASIQLSIDAVRKALESVRAFGSSIANDLSIMQARQTFTTETINTLKAGAADLVNADLNEEGANLLALQTAQQLGVTSLSLASQSQQSVLRLF
jgi:flagellin